MSCRRGVLSKNIVRELPWELSREAPWELSEEAPWEEEEGPRAPSVERVRSPSVERVRPPSGVQTPSVGWEPGFRLMERQDGTAGADGPGS